MGIIYYKLATDLYPGDITKECGLSGAEIDGNFHFLRGMDIEHVELDEEENSILLTRFNGEVLKITGLDEYIKQLVGCDFDLSGTTYDAENGILYLIVNGEEYPVDGFFTHENIHTDCSIIGKGTEDDPFMVNPDIVSGISEDLNERLEELSNELRAETIERKAADVVLTERIEDEESNRVIAIGKVYEDIDTLARSFTAQMSIIDDKLSTETEERKTKDNEISSAVTTEKAAREEADTAIDEAIEELKQEIKSKDAIITEDIVISESSPLYPFITGIWADNVIPSGTTFTEFVEKLCSEDTRMIYYIDTPSSDIDDVVANFGSMATAITYASTVTITGTSNNHIVGIALPKPHSPSKIMLTQSGLEQDATGKFFANVPREIVYNGILYTLYYYKVSVGFRSTLRFDVTIA